MTPYSPTSITISRRATTTQISYMSFSTEIRGPLIYRTARYKITTMSIIPSMIHQISTHPQVDKVDFSSILSFTTGAAYLPREFLVNFVSLCPKEVHFTEGKDPNIDAFALGLGNPKFHNLLGLECSECVRPAVTIEPKYFEWEMQTYNLTNHRSTFPAFSRFSQRTLQRKSRRNRCCSHPRNRKHVSFAKMVQRLTGIRLANCGFVGGNIVPRYWNALGRSAFFFW